MKTSAIIPSIGHAPVFGDVKRVIRMNIGLNNNPCEIGEMLLMLVGVMDIDSFDIDTGKWEGADEPTLVVTGLTTGSFDEIDRHVSAMATTLTQDAIAFKIGGKGNLTYRPDYIGDKYEFDEQYFI